MKCTNCGFESELSYPVCPQCQAQIESNAAAQKILGALKDPLFLVICILMSAVCVLGLSDGGLPLINILLTVFLWLVYAQSRKDIADAKHLRCVSGTVYANYVINYVVAALVVVMGVIFSVAFGFIANDPSFLETLLSGFMDVDYASVAQALAIIPTGIIMIVFVFAAAIVIVYNFFSMRYIHRFAKSVYQSIEAGTLALKHVTAARAWLFVLGVIDCIGCLSSLAEGSVEAALTRAAGGAAGILAGILINKHLSE